MKTIIDKTFHWEAGHRVWSQELDTCYIQKFACLTDTLIK